MSIIRVLDVIKIVGDHVENLDSFVIQCGPDGLSEVAILPGLTLVVDTQNDPITADNVSGWASIQLDRNSQYDSMAKVYFTLKSHYYTCEETRELLNGPHVCKLIANYLQKSFGVMVGLVYLTNDWKLGGRIAARSTSTLRTDYLYYISNRCK